MSQSQALANSHRLKIIKAHALIKALRMQGIGSEGIEACQYKFGELLQLLFQNDQI